MLCKAHVLGGLALGSFAYPYISHIFSTTSSTGSSDGLVFLTAVAIGSLLPDIDSPTSFVGSKTKPISILIHKIFGHRGITHSPIIHGIALLGAFYFANYTSNPLLFENLIIGIFIGAMSHIVIDGMNPRGVPIFYPFTKRRFKYSNIPTKSKMWQTSIEVSFGILASVFFIKGLF